MSQRTVSMIDGESYSSGGAMHRPLLVQHTAAETQTEHSPMNLVSSLRSSEDQERSTWVWRHMVGLWRDMRPYEGIVFVPLSLVDVVLMTYIGKLAGTVYKCLVDVNVGGLWQALRYAAVLYCGYCLVLVVAEWVKGMVAVMWRDRLSGVLHEVFMKRFFHGDVSPHLVDNCDQRMTSEVARLCSMMALVMNTVAASPFKILYYGYVTSTYTGLGPFVVIVVFFVGSVFAQKMVALPLAREIAHLELCEGNFRSGHVRVRDAARDIASQSATVAETNELYRLLQDVLGAQRCTVWRRVALVGVTKCIDYCGALVNYIVIGLAVVYGRGSRDEGAAGDRAEFVSNASFFTLTFIYSLTEVVDLSQNVSEGIALVSRVYGLVDALTRSRREDLVDGQGTDFEMKERSDSLGDVRLGPTLFAWCPSSLRGGQEMKMEVSVVQIRGGLLQDVRDVFPSAPLDSLEYITCIMTLQPGSQLQFESMDSSLHTYLQWERAMMGCLGDTVWSDSVDPKTGKALRGEQGNVWSEVQAFHVLLGYSIREHEVCPFLVHPQYGDEMYPVTFFTSASPETCLKALKNVGRFVSVTQNASDVIVRIENDIVRRPDLSGEPLLSGVSVCVSAGQHVLVTGPNGSGKTTLLKHLCKKMKTNDYVYLPQVPLLAPGRYFWQQVVYPHDGPPSDEDLVAALAKVGLVDLFQSLPNGSCTERDWSSCLSFGEQQRLCLARVFLQRPRVAFLDESTSGLDQASSVELMKNLQNYTTCVTVTHDIVSLKQLFNYQIEICHHGAKGDGMWCVLNSVIASSSGKR
jgi:ABC-type uncharacterized transport system fused permease/ATPase subunit